MLAAGVGALVVHHSVSEPGSSTTGAVVGLSLTLVGAGLLGYAITRQMRHPARVLVSAQLVFDVVFVAALGGIIARRVRERPGRSDVPTGDR